MTRANPVSGRACIADGRALTQSAIPDSGDLQARYDFRGEDGTIPITDQTGNGNDLDNGGYTGVGTTINGHQAGEFDGTDSVYLNSWATISPPYAFPVVIQMDSTATDQFIIDSRNGTTRHGVFVNSSGDWAIGTPNEGVASSTAADTNPHVLTPIWRSSEVVLRLDGAQIVQSSATPGDSTDFNIGSDNTGGRNAQVRVGAALPYLTEPTVSEVEQYLADEFDISLA